MAAHLRYQHYADGATGHYIRRDTAARPLRRRRQQRYSRLGRLPHSRAKRAAATAVTLTVTSAMTLVILSSSYSCSSSSSSSFCIVSTAAAGACRKDEGEHVAHACAKGHGAGGGGARQLRVSEGTVAREVRLQLLLRAYQRPLLKCIARACVSVPTLPPHAGSTAGRPGGAWLVVRVSGPAQVATSALSVPWCPQSGARG
jgi:hypothetical protein